MANLLLICGALRNGSYNRKLLHQAARFWDGAVDWADVDLPLYNGDLEEASGLPEGVLALKTQITDADAVLIATPEYNQSFSGVLKNALDWVSRGEGKPWIDKPVAIISAAAGRAGGARAQYALRLAMTPFQPRLLTGPEVMLAGASKEFDEDGHLTNTRTLASLEALMAKLAREAGRSI